MIRRMDGDHSMGAGALAEAIVSSTEYAQVKAEAWDEGATAARAENFMADDFTETPNPYREEEQ